MVTVSVSGVVVGSMWMSVKRALLAERRLVTWAMVWPVYHQDLVATMTERSSVLALGSAPAGLGPTTWRVETAIAITSGTPAHLRIAPTPPCTGTPRRPPEGTLPSGLAGSAATAIGRGRRAPP